MNKDLISVMMANPYVFFLKFVVEALPVAACVYGLVWLAMRPKNGRRIPSPFFLHLYGVTATVAGGAVFRTIAMLTFAGRSAYETSTAPGIAYLYVVGVPAAVAFGYVSLRLHALAEERSPASDVPIALNVFVVWVKRHMFWVMVAGSMVLLLQAYQDRAKGQVTSSRPESTSQISQPEPSQIDEFLKDAPTYPNPFGKFDPSTAKPVSNADWDSATITPSTQEGSPANGAYGKNDMPVSDVAPTQTAENQEHYRQIYAAHPDADEIVGSPAFKAWVAKYPTYQRFLVKGTAQEIVGMFTAYKNQR